MKKRVLLLVLAVLALTFVFTSCHSHDFQQKEVKTEPTCAAKGVAVFECECGESEEREIPAKGHTWGEPEVVAPTCKESGYTHAFCTVEGCGAEQDKYDIIKASNDYHDYSVDKETLKPNCETGTAGTIQQACKYCGQVDANGDTTIVDAVHDFEIVTKNPSCSEAGYEKEVCKNCGAIGDNKVLEKVEHTLEFVQNVPVTCTADGYDEYKCSECKAVVKKNEVKSDGHDLSADPIEVKATCVADGYKYKKCADCDYTERLPGITEPAKGHIADFDESKGAIIIPATCVNDGSKTPVCSVCGILLDNIIDENGDNKFVEVLYATGEHTYECTEKYLVNSVLATCHADAYKEYHCTKDTDCTVYEKVVEEGTKKKHEMVQVDEVNSTCEVAGYVREVCQICEIDTTKDSPCTFGCVHDTPKQIADHNKFQKIDDKVESTCMDRAYTKWVCDMCSSPWTEYHDDPLKNHGSWGNATIIAPKCYAVGYTEYTCQVDPDCNEKMQDTYVRRAMHEFKTYADGRLECKECGITYRDISAYIDVTQQEGYKEEDFKGYIDMNGNNEQDENDLTWELIVYGKPSETATEIVVGDNEFNTSEFALDVSKGLIYLESEDENATYTITVVYNDGEEKTVTYSGSDVATGKNVYFDLYETGSVSKITINSTAAGTVRFYTNEGGQKIVADAE